MKLHDRKFIQSLGYAFSGLSLAWQYEKHMRFHLVGALAAIFLGFISNCSPLEWLIMIITISLVLFAELMNTAIEFNVDLATSEKKHEAMVAKDVAAAAVLITSINAVAVGLIIFGGKILGHSL